MTKGEFDALFAGLEKASDRARAILYVFVVVYLAVLLYGLNAFAYPARQYTYDYVNLEVRCRYQPEQPKCESLKKVIQDDAKPVMDLAIEKRFAAHQLALFYDDSVATRTFRFPIFGLETDRDLLWLIFPLLGMIGYYIVWLALDRLHSMFRFMIDQNQNNAVRLRLIQSTLMITVPLHPEAGGFTPFHRTVWRLLGVGIFAIPIIVSILTIADETNAIAVLRGVAGEVLMKDATLASQTQLGIQFLLLVIQFSLLMELISVGRTFGREQAETQCMITLLDGQEGGQPGVLVSAKSP